MVEHLTYNELKLGDVWGQTGDRPRRDSIKSRQKTMNYIRSNDCHYN